jgi:hypothetical protein
MAFKEGDILRMLKDNPTMCCSSTISMGETVTVLEFRNKHNKKYMITVGDKGYCHLMKLTTNNSIKIGEVND